MDSDFLLKIYRTCEVYTTKKVKIIDYCCLFSDGDRVIAIEFDKGGNVLYKSKLLLDEEEEIAVLADNLEIFSFKYELLKRVLDDRFFTRNELLIRKYLVKEIEECYSSKNYNKLKFLYQEYFEDDDFLDDNVVNKHEEKPKKIYGENADELYKSIDLSTNTHSGAYSNHTKETFKPTPIISPIYGILDKNYKKEEVIDKKDKPSSYVSRKNADLDAIRKKAYGDLNPLEEISNTKIEDSNSDNNSNSNSNILYDMMSDNSKPVVDQVTLADAEEYFNDLGLEYNIDYKDDRYEKSTGRRQNYNYQDKNKNSEKTTDDDANLEDNLFDLIDSMYEDGDK